MPQADLHKSSKPFTPVMQIKYLLLERPVVKEEVIFALHLTRNPRFVLFRTIVSTSGAFSPHV